MTIRDGMSKFMKIELQVFPYLSKLTISFFFESRGVIMHLGVFSFNLKRSVVIVFLSAN